ncbi:MAG: transcription-repair coupling factor [Myxococcales bacterium]|nr:transcription-repair coupling factor [Myxococcales bacterium]
MGAPCEEPPPSCRRTDARDHARAVNDEADDLPDVLALPEGRRVVTAREVAGLLGENTRLHVVGAEGSAPSRVARALADADAHVLYVAADVDAARRAAADLSFVARGDEAILSLLPPESTPWAEVRPDRRAEHARASALFHLAQSLPWRFLVTTGAGLVRRFTPPKPLCDAGVELVAEDELDLAKVTERLAAAGYLRVPLVEDPGSFAVRGGVFDVWPGSSDLPVRAELYGDMVLSLKTFDPETQRTGDSLERIWLPPAREVITTPQATERAREVLRSLCDAVDYPSSKARALEEDVATARSLFGLAGFLPAFHPLVPLWSYLTARTVVLVEDPARVVAQIREELSHAEKSHAERRGEPCFGFDQLYVGEGALAAALAGLPVAALHRTAVAADSPDPARLDALELAPLGAPSLAIRDHADLGRAVTRARSERGKGAALEPLLRRIAAWHEAGLDVTITARTATQAERITTLLGHRGVRVADAESRAPRGTVKVVTGALARGCIVPTEGFVWVTEEEIFGQRAHRRQERSKSAKAFLEDLRALEVGDYVVHVDHGIGRYLGLEKKTLNGVSVELVVVEYQGGDKLFLPVHRLSQIQKHSGGDGAPKVDRLGGSSFSKTKARVRQRVRQMADELLRLYAERAALEKPPLDPRDDEYAAFEATFPYEETRDQAAAIDEVNHDLEQPAVMDRLVCGDVGFGKTEVALRAAFRVAMSGRQVALLCPTTVLAQQHYLTFAGRLAGYPIQVRPLSRFESKKESVETLKGLKDGSVDVLVGTHRVLSKDVHFKNLGLLIVDEEQRFGVTHKERIKQLRATVDVLTLSATPIPRTLQMAVGGLRDMSLITTPPMDRRAIRTITSRYDDQVVREAIERELSRGGQVFYVYNRVEGIYERAHRVQELVPGAKVAVGHGQMSEATLEQTMLDFVEGRFDVLVSTAIIESGLDIPRANTIIVDRADMFGLSQLYQLRGRVGRSTERAYCYLLVPPPSQLSEEARTRIEALERHTELGAGFQIATLDMEIRGAGDLLGAEQSGFVASVGFDLFCQMLQEASHELRGETVVHGVDPELSFDVDALLPEAYVAEIGVRLSLYKRLSSASDEQEVQELATEMEDRFGPPPEEAKRLVELMRIKTELRKLRVLGCEATAKSVSLHLRDDTPLDPMKIGELVGKKKSPWRISPEGRLTRRAAEGETFSNGVALADQALDELGACVRPDAQN